MATCQGVVGALQYLIGRPETSYGVYDTGGTDFPIPVYDDGYTVRATAQNDSQPFKVGRRGDRYRARSRVDVGGALHTGFFSDTLWIKKMLDYAIAVDGNGCLTPWSFIYVTPGVETIKHRGCYVNKLTISASDGSPDVLYQADLMGRSEEKLTGGDIPALPSFPATTAYQFQYGHFLLSRDAGSTYELFATVDSFNLEIDNNLQPGPHVFDPLSYNKLTRSFINTGIQRGTGSLSVQYKDATFGDMVRAGTRGLIRLMFIHPSSAVTQVNNVAGYAAGSNVSIVVDSSANFAVGDVVLFRTNDGTKTSTATVTVIADGTHITVDELVFAIADDDYIYNKAFEIEIDSWDVNSVPVSGGKASDLKQTVNFEIVDDGTGLPIEYKTKVA